MARKRTIGETLDIYRIELDGKWLLKDFSDFFHFYTEVYSLCFLLVGPSAFRERLPELLERYPWKGGYSAVDFYDDLYVVSRRYRPQVRSIQYASPGFIELGLLISVAVTIRKMVEQFTKSGEAINNLYSSIQKGFRERELMRLDVREKELDLTRKQLEFIKSSYDDLALALQIPEPNEFLEASPTHLAALKVLLSLYRRVRTLAKFQAGERTKL